ARPSAQPAGGGARPAPTRPAPTAPDLRASAPRISRRRLVAAGLVLVLVLALAWPIGLLVWADGKLAHVAALSGAPGTDGTTYLLAGSDSRADGAIEDAETTGQRSDTMMLLHQPASGPAALLSLPRDTYVEIPGQGPGKLNAAYSAGGAPLLVQTVEGLTGMTVDHYVEVGFAGFEQIVDAVGGVNLCSDLTVDDKDSGMVWTPGCRDVGGTEALAFARMRKSDPDADIGRAERQQQLIGSISSRVQDPGLLLQPGKQVALLRSGTAALTVSDETGIVDLGRMALTFRSANGPDGITGTPPISNIDYRPGGVGSSVQLDPDLAPGFFAAIRDGSLPPGAVGGMPAP
ncbi:LCP family protein, partial [Cellulomonas sp. 179-A 4D5 NHS]|uniref:LCP family protein n=1 Tax=Cellulomonas sp. 179-A 4D5 NHS TaxID=3142378 RepID=UPI0039A1B577